MAEFGPADVQSYALPSWFGHPLPVLCRDNVTHSADVVLVTFAARDGDPYPRDRVTGEFLPHDCSNPSEWGPTLRVVADPRSLLFRRVSDVYYLCHPSSTRGKRRTAFTAEEIAEETRNAIEHVLPLNRRPLFHVITLPAKQPPNDHAELFELAKRELRAVRTAHPGREIVLQLSAGTSAMHAVLLLAGAVGILDGPVRLIQAERGEGSRVRCSPFTDVTFQLSTVLRIARASGEAVLSADEAPSLALDQARSSALQQALSLAHRAAAVPFPLMLRGERGVGKSTFARLVRAASPYRKPAMDANWPSVACGQFTDPDRLTAELCGSVRGAFTGARDRPGLLSMANGDTLFLDEIQDLDPRSQRAIIRVLEDGRYYRLGEDAPKRSRFRLITGTNQPDEVLLERLSRDFYDRIRDIELVVPPLRECREDLPWMWQEVWTRVAGECRVEANVLRGHEGRILAALAAHELPGNWRDLRRLAVRLALLLSEHGTPKERSVAKTIDAVFRVQEVTPPALPDAERGPILRTKGDQTRYAKLEKVLGPGLSRLWEACGTQTPAFALRNLLGDRDRARRAAAFLKQVEARRWKSHCTS